MGSMTTFEDAAGAYNTARTRYLTEIMAIAGRWRPAFGEAKRKAEVAAAQPVMDGDVVGNNKEQRDACLMALLAQSEPYQAAVLELREREVDLAYSQATADDQANRMFLARREMDYAIAQINLTAAIEAGRGLEKGDHHG